MCACVSSQVKSTSAPTVATATRPGSAGPHTDTSHDTSAPALSSTVVDLASQVLHVYQVAFEEMKKQVSWVLYIEAGVLYIVLRGLAWRCVCRTTQAYLLADVATQYAPETGHHTRRSTRRDACLCVCVCVCHHSHLILHCHYSPLSVGIPSMCVSVCVCVCVTGCCRV